MQYSEPEVRLECARASLTARGVVGNHATEKWPPPNENLGRASALAVRPKISKLKFTKYKHLTKFCGEGMENTR